MARSVVRADYETLGKMAQTFSQQATHTRQTLQKLKQNIEVLQSGDWVGKGATAFYQEMNSEVLPSITRLSNALEASQRAILQISQIIREAEDESAGLFRIDPTELAGIAIGAAAGAVIGGAIGAATGQTDGTGAGSGNGSTSSPTKPAESSPDQGGGGGGGGGGQATGKNPLLVCNPNSLFTDYAMSKLIGSHFRGADSPELRNLMEQLAGNPTGEKLERILKEIARLRGRPLNEIQAEYGRYLLVRAQAEANKKAKNLEEVSPLSGLLHGDFMGSTPQLRFGSIVGQAFGIDPVFGSMLNPTGGMVGPGNLAYMPGNASAIGYHGAVHDAAGYLYNYHNAGPGYNYLGRESTDTGSPLTGQVSGIRYWTQKVYPASQYAFKVMDGVVNTTRATANAVDSLLDKVF